MGFWKPLAERERYKSWFVCEVSLALGHEWHSLYYYIVYLPSSSCFFKGKVGLGHVISSYFIVLSVTECQRTHQLHKDRPEHCRINRLKDIINSVLTTMWSNWSHCRLYWNIFFLFSFWDKFDGYNEKSVENIKLNYGLTSKHIARR